MSKIYFLPICSGWSRLACSVLLMGSCFALAAQQFKDYPVLDSIDVEALENGRLHKFWLPMITDGLSQPVYVPVMVAKGAGAGPVLGLTAAIHGNELNGIPIIQRMMESLDTLQMSGTVIGVPGLNPLSLTTDRRRYPDEEDLNRIFPGKATGDQSQQYVWRIFDKLIRHFDYHIDLHTASFGRINTLYVRADLANDTLAQMAFLQHADIILNNSGVPSAGDALAATRTLRAEAILHGIPSITVEYGDPQVYQEEMIRKGVPGILNVAKWLGILKGGIERPARRPTICRRSYWIYVDEGGLLEIPVALNELITKGQTIGLLRNPFGDLIRSYTAPADGIVIGKSTNPVNMHGGRILHLGIVEPFVPTIQDLCWSPDGKAIYFSGMWRKPDYSDYKPENWSIYKYDLQSASPRRLVDSALYVTVSPTGAEIAVGKIVDGNRDIVVLDSNGNITRRLTTDAAEDHAPAWSPDGNRIVFNSKRTGKPEIFVVQLDGTGLRRLSHSNPYASYNPQWSPDGKRIVYYLEKGDRKDQIYVMNGDGTGARNITNDTLLNYFPSWAGPDRIIYTQDGVDREAKIMTCDARGRNKRQLLGIESFFARSSPDGKQIAYIDKTDHTIVVVTAEGKRITKIQLP